MSAVTARTHLDLAAREFLTWSGRGRIPSYRDALIDRLASITRSAHRPLLVAALEHAAAELPDRPPHWVTEDHSVSTGNGRDVQVLALSVPAVRRWVLTETRSEDAALRADGAVTLAAAVPDRTVVERLFELTSDPVAYVRIAAAEALAEVAQLPAVRRELVPLAADSAWQVRGIAVYVLAHIETDDVVAVVVGLATTDGRPEVRTAAGLILARMAPSTGAVPRLVASSANPEPVVRANRPARSYASRSRRCCRTS